MADEGLRSIADEAYNLVHGERAESYGHPRTDFRIIAKLWSGLLQDKLAPGEELDEYRVALMMSGLKLARLVKSPHHHDSRVDTIGYMLTMERLDEPDDAVIEELKAEEVQAREEHVAEIEALSEKLKSDVREEKAAFDKETVEDLTEGFVSGDQLTDACNCTWKRGSLGKWRSYVSPGHFQSCGSLASLARLHGPLRVTSGTYAGLVIETSGNLWWA